MIGVLKNKIIGCDMKTQELNLPIGFETSIACDVIDHI
jgi:hypothetical protein